MQLGRHPGGEDRAEGAGVLEEGRHQHEQRREPEKRLEALLDRDAGEEVDHAREREDRQRLEHDATQDRERSGPEPTTAAPTPIATHAIAMTGVSRWMPRR